MKYTISGFSQKGMCDLRLSADDVNILRWFCDFRNSGKMVKEYCAEENCFYYWVKYSGLIESLPYLFYDCKSEETQKKKLQRILNGNLSKVLKKKVIKKSTGTYTFFATIDEQMEKLLGYATGTEMSSVVKHIGMELSSATGTSDTNAHWNESFQPKDSSINNSSINNSSINNSSINNSSINTTTEKVEKEFVDTVIKKWNDIGLNAVRNIKGKRLDSLHARIKEYSKEDVLTVIENVKYSDFLKGNNNRNWTADIDWILKPNNFIKVLEGNYNKDKEHLKRKEIPSFNAEQKPKRKYGF